MLRGALLQPTRLANCAFHNSAMEVDAREESEPGHGQEHWAWSALGARLHRREGTVMLLRRGRHYSPIKSARPPRRESLETKYRS